MIFDDTFIEIRGNREVLVDGFTSLLQYSESEISVMAGKKRLSITGEKLKMDVMTEGKIAVSGIIGSVAFLSQR